MLTVGKDVQVINPGSMYYGLRGTVRGIREGIILNAHVDLGEDNPACEQGVWFSQRELEIIPYIEDDDDWLWQDSDANVPPSKYLTVSFSGDTPDMGYIKWRTETLLRLEFPDNNVEVNDA